MVRSMTRMKATQIWFAAVALVVVAAVAWGASTTIGTAAMLLALCLVPPVLIVMLWPDARSRPSGGAVRRGD